MGSGSGFEHWVGVAFTKSIVLPWFVVFSFYIYH